MERKLIVNEELVGISAALEDLSHNDNAIAWHLDNGKEVIYTFDNPPKGKRQWNKATADFITATLFFTKLKMIGEAMVKCGYNGYICLI